MLINEGKLTQPLGKEVMVVVVVVVVVNETLNEHLLMIKEEAQPLIQQTEVVYDETWPVTK